MVRLKEIKKGNYIVWEGEPCIIKELQLTAYSTNPDTKAKIELQGLFSGKTISTSLPLNKQVQEADVIRKCATVISKTDKGMQVMDAVTFETIDVKVDSELMEQATENDQVTYIQFGNTAKVLEVRKH